MKLLAYIAAACIVAFGCELDDYKDPAVGGQAEAQREDCRINTWKPCGWVRMCPSVERDNEIGALEQCVLWPDRIGPWPVGLERSFESLYGECPLSDHPRFAGTPLCHWQCPSAKGCNSYNGCFCLDEP